MKLGREKRACDNVDVMQTRGRPAKGDLFRYN